MRYGMALGAGAMLLASCQVKEKTPAANDVDTGLNAPANAVAGENAMVDPPEGLAGTSWTFTGPKGATTATFGTDGKYYDIAGGQLVESGTFVEAEGNVCENVDGTPQDDHICWSIPSPLPTIGGTAKTSDGKMTVDITRVAFAGNQPAS